MAWHPLDPVRAKQLTNMRIEAHWAAQVAAAPGTAHLDDPGDMSHTSLTWHSDLEALVGQPVQGLRAGLRVPDLTWMLLDDGGNVLAARSAVHLTLRQGMTWMAERLAEHDLPGFLDVGAHADDLPEHPVAHDAPFTANHATDLAELASWYQDAHQALTALVDGDERAGPVVCWPHHFDIAALYDLGGGRSVGVGMTPGDGGIDEPYFYATCWPYPEGWEEWLTAPPVTGGNWNDEGWFGVVLEGSRFPEDDQLELVAAFLSEGLEAMLDLVP